VLLDIWRGIGKSAPAPTVEEPDEEPAEIEDEEDEDQGGDDEEA
jgi:hypothetical protein